MTGARKIKANRANARASTGAKTVHGKARAAQNARRHGLSLSVLENPVLSEEAENLARKIAREGATHEILNLARRVAEAQIDLIRIRQARHDLLSRDLNDPEFRPRKWDKDVKAITNIALRRFGPDAVLPPLVAEHADRVRHWKPQGAEKLAHIPISRPSCLRWIVMNGARSRGANLRSARLIRRGPRQQHTVQFLDDHLIGAEPINRTFNRAQLPLALGI